MRIYNRLHEILEEKDVSIRELSRRMGFSFETVRNFANNKSTRYSLRLMEHICEEMDVELFELIRTADADSIKIADTGARETVNNR